MRICQALLIGSLAIVASAQNLVQNPGFEENPGVQMPSPWITPAVAGWGRSYTLVRTGALSAYTANMDVGSPKGVLSQAISGSIKTACYRVRFYAQFPLRQTTLTATFGDGSRSVVSSYSPYRLYELFGRASSNDEALTFTAVIGRGTFTRLLLDDVSVELATPTEALENCSVLPSGVFHRRRSLQLTAAESCAMRFNHQQCPIAAGSLQLTCVNTSSDLEYCGRDCTNCLEMEGAQDVGCVDGRCEVASCKAGFYMDDGLCRASSNALM